MYTVDLNAKQHEINALVEIETKLWGPAERGLNHVWISSLQCMLTPIFVLLFSLKNLQGELGKTLQPHFEN